MGIPDGKEAEKVAFRNETPLNRERRHKVQKALAARATTAVLDKWKG